MIGIDISDRSIKVVRLSDDEHPKLLSHCWHEVNEHLIERGVIKDHEAVVKVVSEALDRCSISPGSKHPIIASIPETKSFLRVIQIPIMDESEIGEAIQWEVAQHIPFGIENVYLDWQPVPHGHRQKGRQEVIVGATEKQVVNGLVGVFQTLDLDIAALELESQAIVRSLISPELRQRQGLLIIDLGGSATNVVVHDHGTIRFTASLNRGAFELLEALPPQQALAVTGPPNNNAFGNPDEVAQKLSAGFDELIIEVQGIVEFYTRIDANHHVSEILLTGGGANLPGLDSAFLRHFDNVHIQRGNPWVNILPAGKAAKPPLNLQESIHFSTALGLALRKVIH